MIKGENIIIFSSGDWEMGPSLPQHISIRLAKENKVLFIETFGSRRPTLERDHIKRVKERLLNWNRGIKQLNIGGATIYIYSPITLLLNTRLLLPINRFIFLRLVKRLMNKLTMSNPILLFCLPAPAGALKKLQKKAVIYYSMDDWSTFPVGNNKVFMDAERALIKSADLVLAVNENLYQKEKPYTQRIRKLYHGVDYQHFTRTFPKDAPLPPDIRNIPRPIIAVIGAFANWMDLDLLKLIAQKHREWSIVCIGNVESDVDINPLKTLPNIYFLGQKPYSNLPDYYRAIDVFIVPFIVTGHIKMCAPTRLYEHLSSGKPVITTDFPAAWEVGGGLIDIARDRDDFVKKIEAALQQKNPALIEKRKALAKRNTWEARIEEISGLIEGILNEKD